MELGEGTISHHMSGSTALGPDFQLECRLLCPGLEVIIMLFWMCFPWLLRDWGGLDLEFQKKSASFSFPV